LAIGARLPTMVSNWEFVAAGGLLSYGPSFLDCSGAAATVSIKFRAAQSRLTSQSSNRPSSIWSST
jgi:hypothetical protein